MGDKIYIGIASIYSDKLTLDMSTYSSTRTIPTNLKTRAFIGDLANILVTMIQVSVYTRTYLMHCYNNSTLRINIIIILMKLSSLQFASLITLQIIN